MQQDLWRSMHIQKLGPEHLEQYNDLLRYAFQVTEEVLMRVGWEDDAIRQSKFPILESAHVLGWFDGDKLASQISVYPMQMNIQGSIRDIGLVTGVSTYPEYSGQGLMSKLMKECLGKMREQGQSIALLYPYSVPLYRHKGWEIISDKMSFTLMDHQLPRGLNSPGRVRRVDDDDADLLALHDEFARRHHGCLVRNALAWEEYWRWDVEDVTQAVYYSEDDKPLGYMVYLLKNDAMRIKEIVCLDYEAWKGLWAYIAAHESMVNEISGSSYYDSPLAFWLEDSAIKETIQPYMMGRIVDVRQFLSGYRFRHAARNDAITFEVSDKLLEWNNGCFTLSFSEQEAPQLFAETGEADEASELGITATKRVKLSIGTLTTLLMSYKRPGYLRCIEKLEGDDEAIALLEEILPDQKAYFSDYL